MQQTGPPAKTDPRVRRTRRLLRDALVSLILERDDAKISIREITDRADVAYITFFRHFDSPDQLLMEVLEGGLAQLLAHIELSARQSGKPDVETEGRLIFEYVRENADLFRVLFRSQSATRIRRTVVQKIAAIFRSTCTPLRKSKSPVAVDMAANHVATSLLALIEWWLENKMSPPPAQMGRVYKNMIIASTVDAALSLPAGMG